MLNVIAAVFKNESEGYQAITTLKGAPVKSKSAIIEMALVKHENNSYKICDGFKSEGAYGDDTAAGGIVGSLVGVIGGPLGVLLGGATGAMAGNIKDAAEAVSGQSLIECVVAKMYGDTVSLVILANEEDEAELNSKLNEYDVEILRFDAAAVAAEVEEAAELEKEMSRQARAKLREERKEEHMKKAEEKIAQLNADSEILRQNFVK